MTERVGVLGASGYVGQAVVRNLEKRGYDVRPAAGSDHEAYPVVDVRDREVVRSFVDSVDCLVDAAGMVGIDTCRSQPDLAYTVNGLGGAHAAWACVRADVPLVHLSTVATIGDPGNEPITAATPREPTTTYGRTKLVGERAARTVTDGRVPSITFLPTNVYGDGGGSVLDYFLERAVAGEALPVHRPGTQQRDLIHVRDVADAVTTAVDHLTELEPEPVARSYVLGRGRSYSVLELAGLVADEYRRQTGSELGIELCERPNPDASILERFDVEIESLRRNLGVDPNRDVVENIGDELEQRRRRDSDRVETV